MAFSWRAVTWTAPLADPVLVHAELVDATESRLTIGALVEEDDEEYVVAAVADDNGAGRHLVRIPKANITDNRAAVAAEWTPTFPQLVRWVVAAGLDPVATVEEVDWTTGVPVETVGFISEETDDEYVLEPVGGPEGVLVTVLKDDVVSIADIGTSPVE